MKYVDSIQPPLAIYGELTIENGRAYYWTIRHGKKRFNPTLAWLDKYAKRKTQQKYDKRISFDIVL